MIKFFNNLGRKQSIVPVLVDGVPSVFDPIACPQGAFPPALGDGIKPLEALAPDLRDVPDGGDGSPFSEVPTSTDYSLRGLRAASCRSL